MKTTLRAAVALTLCCGISGCAAPGGSSLTTARARLVATRTIPEQAAKGAITIGKSTKADVIAALGSTTVIRFDSGFEVWVYQYPDAGTPGSAKRTGGNGDNGEFVLLFAPSGVVTKTRFRPAPPPVATKGT